MVGNCLTVTVHLTDTQKQLDQTWIVTALDDRCFTFVLTVTNTSDKPLALAEICPLEGTFVEKHDSAEPHILLNSDASTDVEKYLPVAADVASELDVARAFEFIEQQVGGLDVLVNNACHLGLGHRFLDMPITFFDEVLAEHQIRVNCVVPGYIYTERWDTLPEETKQRRWKNVPLGKESSPEDIGETAAFLASSKAGNITGSSLLVSGGVDIQMVPPDCAV